MPLYPLAATSLSAMKHLKQACILFVGALRENCRVVEVQLRDDPR